MAESGNGVAIFGPVDRAPDGCSRSELARDIRPTRREADAEIVFQKAREANPEARPRIMRARERSSKAWSSGEQRKKEGASPHP